MVALPLHRSLYIPEPSGDLGHNLCLRESDGGHHHRQSSHLGVDEGMPGEGVPHAARVGMVDCSMHRGEDLQHIRSRTVRCVRKSCLCS